MPARLLWVSGSSFPVPSGWILPPARWLRGHGTGRQGARHDRNALVEANSGLHDIVRVRVFVPNPEDVTEIAGILKDRIGFTRPANTTVCSPLAVPGALVEIEVDAIRGSGTPE